MSRADLVRFVEAASSVLMEAGYRVQSPGRVSGLSGAMHKVDLLATRNNERLLIDVENEDFSVGPGPVIGLYTKMVDTRTSKATLIAIPRVNTMARRLSKLYRIMVVESGTPIQTAAILKERLSESPSARPAPQAGLGGSEADATRTLASYMRKMRFRVIKGSLEVLVLASLNQTPSAGYDIIRDIHSRFKVLLSPGTVYPILKRLEGEGLINAEVLEHKKIYTPTSMGARVSSGMMPEFEDTTVQILNHLRTTLGASA